MSINYDLKSILKSHEIDDEKALHESVQPELNMLNQKVQQIGEIVVNGLKMINKASKEGDMAA